MTFLAPAYFLAACGVALAVVALHFLVTREPRTSVFPTVRFVPPAQVRSLAIALKLTDILLLLLRVAIVLLLGAALAQPRLAPIRKDQGRIVAVDVSRAVSRTSEWHALVEKHTSGADVIVAFGSSAAEVSPEELDVLLATPSGRVEAESDRGSLSAGLIASLRAASRIRDRANAIELVFVSPLAREELDAATLSIRKLWPGGMTMVHAPSAPPHVAPTNAGKLETERASDRAAAEGESENDAPRPQVEWADAGTSALWIERPSVETIGGVRAGDATLIYPFERRWKLKEPVDSSIRVIARWLDGEPAAVERTAGANGACVRSVGFAIPKVGDIALRSDFARFMRSLEEPCGATPDLAPLAAELVSRLAGERGPVRTSSVAPPAIRATPLVPWLLLAALILLVLEYPLRKLSARRREVGSSQVSPEEPASLRAAA